MTKPEENKEVLMLNLFRLSEWELYW